MVLQTDFKLSIFYLRSGAIQVIVPSQYSNRICGMCGNFNHETEDDFKIPDGYLVQDTHVLGQSMCGEPTLLRVCTDAEEQKYASEVYCGILTSRQGLFSTCSSVLNADSFFRSCMFDMCTTHGDPAALCNAIEAFSATCDKVGISVLAWRNTTFCRMYLTFPKIIYKKNILVINSTVLIDKECVAVMHPQWKSMRVFWPCFMQLKKKSNSKMLQLN